MMRIIFSLILAVIAMTPLQAGGKGGTRVTFATRVHNFGTVSATGGEVKCEFEFTNTGSRPITVTKTATSCECTLVRHSKAAVKSGEKGKIAVIYSPAGHHGNFMKNVYIYFNGSRQPITLVIRGAAR